jgi:hypothetical protein
MPSKAVQLSPGTVTMTQNRASLTRRWILGATVVLLANATHPGWTQASPIVVHKGPKCGCCSGWVRHLEKAGFVVTVTETADLDAVKKALGVPDLASCHTAEVDGYVLEGAAAVRRLLEKRPTGVGLAVPGMPAGSPGMEIGVPDEYEVVLFGTAGRQTFMHFVGAEYSRVDRCKAASARLDARRIDG